MMQRHYLGEQFWCGNADLRVNLDEILRRVVWERISVIVAGKLHFGC